MTTTDRPADATAGGHLAVLIVGAGLSGIGAASHLQTDAPGTSYAILEARAASGGTWDLFRYPGVRSDSDMFTLGYAFRPWKDAKAIAGGAEILRYVARLLRLMEQNGYAIVTPRLPSEPMDTSPFIEMTSGYFERERATLPLQGDRAPWRLQQHYFKDAALFRGPVDGKELEFRPAPPLVPSAG